MKAGIKRILNLSQFYRLATIEIKNSMCPNLFATIKARDSILRNVWYNWISASFHSATSTTQ